MKPETLFSRKFALLTTGEVASLFGDHFTRIATVWLVLELTSSSSAVGIVLAVGAIPRAACILLGGALADRYSPISLMLWSNTIRAALVTLLVVLATADLISFPVLCVVAFLFGAAGALYSPSIAALLPRIVPVPLLQAGNSIVHGAMHISNLLGPPLAALVLAQLLGDLAPTTADANGQLAYAYLFAIDVATFLVSILTLCLITTEKVSQSGADNSGVGHGIWEGIRFVFQDSRIRILVLVVVVANFGIGGPLAVALPLMAKFSLSQGVIGLGLLTASGALGSLLGIGASTMIAQKDAIRIFSMPFVLLPILGLLMISLGQANSIQYAALILAMLTAIAAYIDIQVLTWLQQSVSSEYLGRVMSILQLCAFGTMPMAMAIAGLIGKHLSMMLAAFGIFVVLSSFGLILASRSVLRLAKASQL